MSNYIKKLSTKTSQQAQIPLFYFDDEYPDPNETKFWTKGESFPENKKINPSFGCFLYKKSKKKFGELKSTYICVYKNYLICAKSKDWSSKEFKCVDLAKHFITFHKLIGLSGKYNAGISLTYNLKQVELYARNVEELNGFLYQLKKNVIQTNFEEMYILDSRLGSGSYADVYKVRDRLTRRDYAAKFFDITSFRDADKSKIALMNEVRIHRQLEHGNICRLHEVYESPTHIIVVMEYAKGERLIDFVINNSPLKEKECMTIEKELLEAIIYLHSLNIIHRDIKLENILINKEDGPAGQPPRFTLKLIDFGLSVTTENIEFFKRSGTPGYVAPEVLIAETYETKVDVFSLGVVLFTMLCGRSPFVGSDRAAVLKLNRNCEFSFKPKYWNNKTVSSKDLVKKMMEADPEKRITAKEALNHKWFNPINTIGVVQSLKTLSGNPLSNRSQGALDNQSVDNKNVEKSQTLSTDTRNHKKIPGDTKPSNKLNQNNRSNSAKINVSPRFSTKFSLQSKKSNLLQIPNQLGMQDEEEEKEEMEVSHRINRASLRSFYKLHSGENEYESVQQVIEEEESPGFDSNYNHNDIPAENPGLKKKVGSLKSYRSMKSPFRLNSKDPSFFETARIEVNTRKESCELSCSDTDEEIANKVPRYPSTIKASMVYIRKTSKIPTFAKVG